MSYRTVYNDEVEYIYIYYLVSVCVSLDMVIAIHALDMLVIDNRCCMNYQLVL